MFTILRSHIVQYSLDKRPCHFHFISAREVSRVPVYRILCRSKLNGVAKIYFAAYSCFWLQNQSNSYFDLCQKHEKTSPQNKFSRLVLTGTIPVYRASPSPPNESRFTLKTRPRTKKHDILHSMLSSERVEISHSEIKKCPSSFLASLSDSGTVTEIFQHSH